MKRNFILGMTLQALVLTTSLSVFAQTQNTENQAMIEVVNDPMPAAKAQSQTNTQANTQTQSVSTSAPVILQNQPQITQTQPVIYVQKQETTVVEDSPLVESAADKLRKQRIEVEQQTESKIVEKLEESRMKAEQERAAKLLSGLEEKKEEKKEEEKKVEETLVVAPVMAPQAVQVVAPQETVIVQQAQVNEAPVIEVKSELAKLDEEEKKSSNRMFISADAGFLSYDAENIQTNGALGVTVGTLIDERFIVEGSFLFSKGDIESVVRPVAIGYNGQIYPTIIEMQQYNFSGALKYRILKTKISPYIGGLLSYTHRSYEDTQFFDTSVALESSSWAIDAGVMVGADIRLTDSFTIGADLRYVMNVAYDTDTNGRLQTSKSDYNDFYTDPVEELGYYNFLINAKFSF